MRNTIDKHLKFEAAQSGDEKHDFLHHFQFHSATLLPSSKLMEN